MAELSEDGGLEVQPVHTAVYTVATDSLVLEGGVVLKAGDLVNGVVVGIWGKEVTKGKFSVESRRHFRVCFVWPIAGWGVV